MGAADPNHLPANRSVHVCSHQWRGKLEIPGHGPGPWNELGATCFDDSGWSNGIARLGYGDPATATTVNYGPEANDKFVTTYFRRSFIVPWNAVITNLDFRLARADGAASGSTDRRFFAPICRRPDPYKNTASSAMTVIRAHTFYPTNVPVALAAGTNWMRWKFT